MDIYDRINLLVKEKGTTRKKMCADLNISYHTLNSLFKRRTERIPFDMVKDISNYLDADIEYLVYGTPSDDLNGLQEIYNSLSVNDKNELINYANYLLKKSDKK